MITTRTTAERFRLLGVLRAFLVQEEFETIYSNEPTGHVEKFQDLFEGFVLATSEVGLEIEPTLVLPHIKKHDDAAEFILENTILDDSLASQIGDQFGSVARFNFNLAQTIATIRLLSMFRWSGGGSLPTKRRQHVNEQRHIAHEALSAISTYLTERSETIEQLFGSSFRNRCQTLATWLLETRRTPKRFRLASDLTDSLVNDLLPNYGEIEERRQRSRELIKELSTCAAGRSNWSEYEDVCIKCLRFLFSPPFKSILIQRRTSDNHERRDAILTNNQYDGFWRLIREEFDSRHVVCEFKNKSTGLSKNDLNQLRIYLLRPTIGRFGLLFVREGSSTSLRQAQRNAYEQSQILILVINDRMLTSMMKLRTFTGAAEHILEAAKARFEVEY